MTGTQRKQLTVVAAGIPVASSPADGIEVLTTVSTDRDAVREALTLHPDVLLLRLAPDDDRGIAVLRQTAGTPVLVLTPPGASELVIAAMRAGARGLLHDDVARHDLVRAIRVVAGGAAVFGKDAADRLYGRLNAPEPAEAFPNLTAREHEVLRLLADDLGNAAIADRLRLAPKTVRNIVCSILAKFGAGDRADVVAQAREAGLGGLN